jgi:hypothetical protein
MTPGLLTLVCFALLATTCSAAPLTDAGWKVYRSPDYGFTISYPGNISFYAGHPDLKETQLSMIPICDETTVACFEYNGNNERTNLEAAGLSVNVLRDRKTEQDCNKIDTGSYPIETESINGIKFHYGKTGSVAAGHSEGGPVYRAFYQNVCFEMAVGIASTDTVNDDPGDIKPFDSAELEKLLDRMVHTFKFMAAVKDGHGWRVSDDSGCGGSFEFPEGERIQIIKEFSQAGYYSQDITCSRHFTHNGLGYTVAAKVNLRDQSQFESWLESSGYPGLTTARIVTKSKYFTEYTAGPYYYVFGQGTVYILSVSDAEHRAIVSHNDPVFMHLLQSFKVR